MNCPACQSPDTVSYWTGAKTVMDKFWEEMLRYMYPDARRCVDCEHVWWSATVQPDFKKLGKFGPS